MRRRLSLAASAIFLVVAGSGTAGAWEAATLLSTTSAYDWSGFYVGADVGGVWGDGDHTSADVKPFSFDVNGGAAGILGGVNWQQGAWVFGGEIDATWTNAGDRVNATLKGGGKNAFRFDLNSMASARVRGGYSFGRTMVYGTAGIAGAWMHLNDVGFGKDDASAAGFIFGAGAEYALTDTCILRGEVLAADFGTAKFKAGTVVDKVSLSTVVVRGAAIFKF